MPKEEPEEPSGVLASPPPVNYEIFGRHAAVIEEHFDRDPMFGLILLTLECADTEETVAEADEFLAAIEGTDDPVSFIRDFISNKFPE